MRWWGTGLAAMSASVGLAIASPVHRDASAPPITAAMSPRTITPLGSGWQFRFGNLGDAPSQLGFDDSHWKAVSVPHTWNRIGNYDVARAADTDNRQGPGWYRLTYQAPALAAGRRVYLDFAAVSNVADVWVNGVHVGQHKGAFSRFRFDVTRPWKPGRSNLIAVRADNSKPGIGSITQDVLPLSGDFFVYGGIYRPVALITAADAGIDLLDYGGPGVYARTTSLTDDQAQVAVMTRLRNVGTARRHLTVVTTVRDASGTAVAEASLPFDLDAGSAEARSSLSIAKPHRWDGRADPYLYSVTVAVKEGRRVVDATTQPLGLRTFRFTADSGFYLNGRYLKLHGISRHQAREGKGWALAPADQAEDMELIRDMGANTVRLAHYQHSDDWVSEADRAGMVAWAEIPYVDIPSFTGGEGSPALWANAENQLRELIRQDYNHPSIMMWSVANEVSALRAERVATIVAPLRPRALLRRLAEIAHDEDADRPSIFADCCEDPDEIASAGDQLAGSTDLIGYNRYYGWYNPMPLEAGREFAAQLDALHKLHAAIPLSVSEYGGGSAISQHSDNVFAGYLNVSGRPQPEEFESFVHEANWPVLRDRKYVFASWIWTMFDFPSDFRTEGDSTDLNTKGMVTFDRHVKKDVFYYYRANWSASPTLWITGKRYRRRAYSTMAVSAYASASRARLIWNDADMGTIACPDHVCRWPILALRPGANQAVVTSTQNGLSMRDDATWIGPDPEKDGIRIDCGDLAGQSIGMRRFGSDNFVTGGEPHILNLRRPLDLKPTPLEKIFAADPSLFDFWREGSHFGYDIPAQKGSWSVTIRSFAPRALPPGATMSIAANGRSVVSDWNLRSTPGGAWRETVRQFTVSVRDRHLKLDFVGTGGNAVVAAIEIERQSASRRPRAGSPQPRPTIDTPQRR